MAVTSEHVTLGQDFVPCTPLTLSLCSHRAEAKSIMEAYFVYSNGTALDVNQLSVCVPGWGPRTGTALHPDQPSRSRLRLPWQAHTVRPAGPGRAGEPGSGCHCEWGWARGTKGASAPCEAGGGRFAGQGYALTLALCQGPGEVTKPTKETELTGIIAGLAAFLLIFILIMTLVLVLTTRRYLSCLPPLPPSSPAPPDPSCSCPPHPTAQLPHASLTHPIPGLCSYKRKLSAMKALKVATTFSPAMVQQGAGIPGTNQYNAEG